MLSNLSWNFREYLEAGSLVDGPIRAVITSAHLVTYIRRQQFK